MQLTCSSGNCPNGNREHNIEGALDVLGRVGSLTGFDPEHTYRGYNSGNPDNNSEEVNGHTNLFMKMYNAMTQSSVGWSPTVPPAPIPEGLQ